MQTRFDKELLDYFTDVEHLRDAFKASLAAPTLTKRLLVIHGVGGVGKSSLLRILRLHCKSMNVPVALASGDEAKSALDVLYFKSPSGEERGWVPDLKVDGVRFPKLDAAFERYRAIQAKVDERSRKAHDTRGRAARLAGTAASKTAEAAGGALAGAAIGSVIPGVGTAIGGVLGGVLGGMGAEALVDWLRGFLKQPDIDLLLDPAKELTDDFLTDVALAADQQRIVLMLDTFEQMTALDKWAREVAQRANRNLLLVIAGRAVPDWSRAWQGWMANAQVEELKPMSEGDMRSLVRRYYATMRGGEPKPAQVEAIVRFARGLPMVVTSAVQLWVKYGVEDFHVVKAEIVANLVDRLMEGVPQEMIPALEAAASVRWYDQPILRAVTGQADVRAVYDELRRFPFVRARAEGLALHDAVREIMDENLHAQDPERHGQLHERAAAYFEKQLEKATGEEVGRLILETLYHRFQIDEKSGATLLQELFEQADRLGQQEMKVKLLDEAHQYRFRDPQHTFLLTYLVARSARDWKEREVMYRALLNEDINMALRVKVLRLLGGVLAFQGKSEEARLILEQALAAAEQVGDTHQAAWARLDLSWQTRQPDQSRDLINLARYTLRELEDEYGLATAELELGYHHLGRWQADLARDAFHRCLSLHEKIGLRRSAAIAQERIGQTYLIEGVFGEAIRFKEKALGVFEELQDEWNVAWTLDELATCYIPVGKWELALNSLERARSVFVRWNDHRATACVARKGHVYRLQGRLDLAMETYLQALNHMPRHNAWTRQGILTGMGNIHQERKEFDEARIDFQQAVAEFQTDGMEFEAKLIGSAILGSLYLAQGQLQDALQHYALCLELAESRGNHAFECSSLLGICQSSYRLADFDQLSTRVGRVKALGQMYGYYHFLAEIYLLQGHLALDDTSDRPEKTAHADSLYHLALRYALLYNRFELDETVQEIISHCTARGEDGSRTLTALRDGWRTGANDIDASRHDTSSPIPEGIALMEAERIAREREPGDGSPQDSVVEQIEAVLKETGAG